jgi:hypothetical protein
LTDKIIAMTSITSSWRSNGRSCGAPDRGRAVRVVAAVSWISETPEITQRKKAVRTGSGPHAFPNFFVLPGRLRSPF